MGPRHFSRRNEVTDWNAHLEFPSFNGAHGISAVEIALTDLFVLIQILAHNASTYFYIRYYPYAKQRAGREKLLLSLADVAPGRQVFV